MQKHFLSHQQTGYLNQFMMDYINGDYFTKQFYSVAPDLNALISISTPDRFTHINRSILVSVLKKQNQKLQLPKKVADNIEALAGENTYCCVTAHQLNIFTGPLYTIFKTITAIKACLVLQEQKPDARYVPVFYLGSEDHDFEEVNHIHLFSKTYTWQREVGGACGRLVTHGLSPLIEEIKSVLGDSEFANSILRIFSEAYSTEKTLAEATRFILNALFGAYGLVIIDSDDAELKALSSHVIHDELEHNSSFHLVSKTNVILKTRYHEQAHAREINLFYIDENIRERIIWEVHTKKYRVLHTDLSFSKEEMVQLVELHPEKFSPNVILRPLFQQQILPALAYIGGGGELSYWLQLQAVFDYHNIPFPALVLRNSVLIIDQATQKKIKKLEIDIPDFFQAEPLLIKDYVRRKGGDDISLNDLRQAAAAIFQTAFDKAKAVDITLEKAVNAEQQNFLNSLERLEGKLIKAQKNLLDTELNQLKGIKQKFFPDSIPQERYENIMQWYVKYGDSFIDLLVNELEPFQKDLTILLMD